MKCLDENARMPITQIAKKIRLSVSNTNYRLQHLRDHAIITEFYLLINPFAFTGRYDRIILKLRNDYPREELIAYCRSNPRIGWFFEADGDWNFAFQVWSTTITQTQQVLHDFLSAFSEYIREYVISSVVSIKKYEHHFIYRQQTTCTAIIETPTIALDALDRKIISLLFRNARMTLLEVGAALKADYKTIAYRLKNLEKKGVIIGYKTQINRFTLGYDYYKIILRFGSFTKKDITRLKEYLLSDPRVLFITEALGWADLEFEFFGETQDDYRKFQETLKKQFAKVIKEYDVIIPKNFEWNHIIPTTAKD